VIKWLLALLNAVSLLVILLFSAIEIPAFTDSFYKYEFQKNNTCEIIGISEYEIMSVTNKLTDYMRGRAPDLVVTVSINGEYREFFNDLEKAHMVDVKNLFSMADAVRGIAITLFLITFLCAFLMKERPAFRQFAKAIIGVLAGFLALALSFAFFALRNFDSYFTTFHEIFFDNDMWILDPATDLLINMVPLPFFIDIFIAVTGIFVGFATVCALLCIVYLKINKPAEVR
jgi:integral membrane protein (TIGR01906 family)